MNTEWKGKWALVTGASAGIGLAFAHELADSAGTSEIEHPVIDEGVVKDGIGLA